MTYFKLKGKFVIISRSLGVMRDGCYAKGFQFDSHLADFRCFSLFSSRLGVTFSVGVRATVKITVRFRVYLLRLVRFTITSQMAYD